MANFSEEFSFSSNGDRWFLTGDGNGTRYVLHKANASSGGAETRFEIADFLKIDIGSPQHQALKALLSGPSPVEPAETEDAASEPTSGCA